MDVNMAAGGGRCPLAQVLRNSLSGHPPTTGTTRCHVSIDSRQASDDRLAEQIPGIPNTSALNKRFGSGSALSNVKIITEEVHHLNQMLFTQEPLA